MHESCSGNGQHPPLEAAKARLRHAAHRPPPPPAPNAAPTGVVGEVIREHPGATASVVFALAATLGPGRLIKGGLLALRVASAVKLARALRADERRS